MALSIYAFLGKLLATEDDLAGKPEYEAWKLKNNKADPCAFIDEQISQTAFANYAKGIMYSVYRPGDELVPFVHVGDFADEKSALKALVTEKGEAYAWNQEGKTLATRYDSTLGDENKAAFDSGTVRVHQGGIAPPRRPIMNQAGLDAALSEVEQYIAQLGSIKIAKRFLLKDGEARFYRPNEDSSAKTGGVIWADENIVIQDVGERKFVIHDAIALKQAMQAESLTDNDIKNPVEIGYANKKMFVRVVTLETGLNDTDDEGASPR